MNLAQRIVLILAFACFSAMTIFPPWLYVHEVPNQRPVERPAGYHLLFGQHTPQDIDQLANLFGLTPVEYDAKLRYFAMRLDGMRLFVQVGLTLLLIVILLFCLQTKL
jgi:hypothetical protein